MQMAAERTARVVWTGNLLEGNGTATMVSSGAFGDFPVTWASRAEDPQGRTSPEELMAAAHATCYAMAFSHHLAENGTPPARLEVGATYTFVPGTGITKAELEVQGDVPGLDQAAARGVWTARGSVLTGARASASRARRGKASRSARSRTRFATTWRSRSRVSPSKVVPSGPPWRLGGVEATSAKEGSG